MDVDLDGSDDQTPSIRSDDLPTPASPRMMTAAPPLPYPENSWANSRSRPTSASEAPIPSLAATGTIYELWRVASLMPISICPGIVPWSPSNPWDAVGNHGVRMPPAGSGLAKRTMVLGRTARFHRTRLEAIESGLIHCGRCGHLEAMLQPYHQNTTRRFATKRYALVLVGMKLFGAEYETALVSTH